MTVEAITLRSFTDLSDVRETLVGLYAAARAELLHLLNYKLTTFAERLDRHGAEPGWESVIAYEHGEAVGYAYANTIEPGNRWWSRMISPPPNVYTSGPVVAIKEIGMVQKRRGQGVAQRIHDDLLESRAELYTTLCVNGAAGGGKVQELYERWGYMTIGRQEPLSPDSPQLTCMGRSVSERFLKP
ncbi:GNAT family N-acetyltransferase [Streptomyces celluloflavus]|uniref:GNAT family N-acetyltransferase n=1 Tax=Streptomyces celluloflavus TaxID=58344 RepID=UPI003679277B